MSKFVNITVDSRSAQVKPDIMLLEALQGLGVEIPTLCHHPSLSPDGACRLCVVEISKKGWGNWTKLVTSCLYPVEEGLIISTHSKKVKESRKTLLELYLSNSPDSEELKAIARLEGVDSTPFPLVENADNCINCYMCIRTCQDLGPSAISTLNRGIDKQVGPGETVSRDCTGCLSCAFVCPTNHIKIKTENQKLTIWNKEFKVPICKVDDKKCTACGVCEEACPFSIPKVSLFINGNALANISKTDCVGCGICAGVCPNGAITQEELEPLENKELNYKNLNLKGKKVVFACSRSKTERDNVVLVSCIGKVSAEDIFQCLAKGADSVGLMCRDQATCTFGAGGVMAEKKLPVLQELLSHVGFADETVQVLKPEYGKEGPDKSIDDFRKSTIKSPVSEINNELKGSGFEKVLSAVNVFKSNKINPILTGSYKDIFSKDGDSALYLGNALVLDMLLKLVSDEHHVRNFIQKAVEFLKLNNINAVPVFTAEQAKAYNKIYTISNDLPEFGTNQEIINLNTIAGFDIDNNTIENIYNISKKRRREILDKAKQSKKYNCNSIEEVASVAFVIRKGSWQEALDVIPQMEFCTKIPVEQIDSKELRITNHPIMPQLEREEIEFTFNGKPIKAKAGEVISSALYASGVTVFGHHHRDGGAQGIYCVNGQCSQCMVIANDKPVKSCMIPVMPGMKVESVEGHPELREAPVKEVTPEVEDISIPVLVIGGGPAGICAATELGRLGVDVILVDDKPELGGKLSLQTHNFFGSVSDCWAGTRGIDIGYILNDELDKLSNVKVMNNTTVVGVYVDKKFGVVTNGQFRLITPGRVLIAAGAREKTLAFPGADLPGVYGAGAFQTLVNRDLIKCAKKLFIVGGGNVGLIGAYHALQAGIDVIGLVEALPACGGYKVHEDKIKRLGVPVLTSHTILKVEGKEGVESVTIAQINNKFQTIEGTEQTYEVDTVLIAVGLSPVNEFLAKAELYGIKAYAAGDAEEIAEASAAIFSGKITGRKIAKDMGIDVPVPSNWEDFGDILKHKPTPASKFLPIDKKANIQPVIRCVQEIPCDPCVGSCPKNLIIIKDSILSLPDFEGECLGCNSCVHACPGLAITLVMNNYDPENKKVLVTVPFEFINSAIPVGKEVITTDLEGNVVGKGKVIAACDRKSQDRRKLLQVEVPAEDKLKVAGFIIRKIVKGKPLNKPLSEDEDPIICRCERVTKSEIIKEIRAGVRDLNQLKAANRAGLGGCGGKTCKDLILRIFREEGIPQDEITMPTDRPLVAEVHLGDFVKEEVSK